MLLASAETERKITEKASYWDVEPLVRAIGNSTMTIDQAALNIWAIESSKENLDIHKSEEVAE